MLPDLVNSIRPSQISFSSSSLEVPTAALTEADNKYLRLKNILSTDPFARAIFIASLNAEDTLSLSDAAIYTTSQPNLPNNIELTNGNGLAERVQFTSNKIKGQFYTGLNDLLLHMKSDFINIWNRSQQTLLPAPVGEKTGVDPSFFQNAFRFFLGNYSLLNQFISENAVKPSSLKSDAIWQQVGVTSLSLEGLGLIPTQISTLATVFNNKPINLLDRYIVRSK